MSWFITNQVSAAKSDTPQSVRSSTLSSDVSKVHSRVAARSATLRP